MIDALILRTKTDRATRLRNEHGDRGTYVRHMDLPNRVPAVLIACQCPGGHGPAGLPQKFWLSCDEAVLDLVRVTATVTDLTSRRPATSAPSHADAA